MTLSEFKWIWYMEFAHRTWGRAIGAVMFIPAIVFWAKGYFNKGMKVRVPVYCALVAAQVIGLVTYVAYVNCHSMKSVKN